MTADDKIRQRAIERTVDFATGVFLHLMATPEDTPEFRLFRAQHLEAVEFVQEQISIFTHS